MANANARRGNMSKVPSAAVRALVARGPMMVRWSIFWAATACLVVALVLIASMPAAPSGGVDSNAAPLRNAIGLSLILGSCLLAPVIIAVTSSRNYTGAWVLVIASLVPMFGPPVALGIWASTTGWKLNPKIHRVWAQLTPDEQQPYLVARQKAVNRRWRAFREKQEEWRRIARAQSPQATRKACPNCQLTGHVLEYQGRSKAGSVLPFAIHERVTRNLCRKCYYKWETTPKF